MVQHICILFNLPLLNELWVDPNNKFKMNSLAFEPSHAARIVALLMFCYISIKEYIVNQKYDLRMVYKSDLYVWLAFLYAMIMMGSATAFLFLSLILLKFIRAKNLLPFSVLVILVVLAFQNIEAFDRAYRTVLATLTLDESTIIETDHSASFRIVPVIASFKMMNIFNVDFWFGHGIDYIKLSFDNIIPNVDEASGGGGGFPGFIIEYGMIPFILFMIIAVKNCLHKKDILGFIFYLFLVFLGGFNHYITWLTLTLLATNKFFYKKSEACKHIYPITTHQVLKL
jgi:hypothetical protein